MEAILIRGGTIDVNKWRQYCLEREIARFSERHVTRFRPITCMYFEMRYNNNDVVSGRRLTVYCAIVVSSSPTHYALGHAYNRLTPSFCRPIQYIGSR